MCLLLIPEIWQGIDFYRDNHDGMPTLSILGRFNTWLDQKHLQWISRKVSIPLWWFLLCKNGYTNSQLEKKPQHHDNIIGNSQVAHIFHILSDAWIKRIETDKTLNCIFQNIYQNVKDKLGKKYSQQLPLVFFFLLWLNENSLRSKTVPNTMQKLWKINLNWRK